MLSYPCLLACRDQLSFKISCSFDTKRRGKRATMTSANTQITSYSPSSSSKSTHQFIYDVFLSFRGEDTRNNFTDHLYEALISPGIRTFRDDEGLKRGGIITSELLKAIEESKIFVIILSKNYATSRWCLDELVKISEYMAVEQRRILPIFYHVDPSEVRKQEGSYKKAFDDHEEGADEEKREKIQKWRAALTKVGNLSGYDLKEDRSEANLIKKIREDIIKGLNRKALHVGENIVGLEFHLKQLKSLIESELDKVCMVGIYGIGGIGKTTIAMTMYNDISSQFEGSVFLKNVGGKNEDDLVELQETLLQDILKCERPKFQNTHEGIVEIQKNLHSKRVLIVIDDVDNYTQLENLAAKCVCYAAKSLIIITTRNLDLLNRHEVEKKYEMEILDHEKSTELFCLWAFKQKTPKPDFICLSNSIVKYAGGLPLALSVLGGMLFGNTEKEIWQSALDKLKKIPHDEVQSKLKVSYNKLDRTKQKMFLDIACFFRGKDIDFVSRIFGSYAKIEIKDLQNKCLITISENKLDMHDLLQQMGQEIVHQECDAEPGQRSRLWDCNDVESVLTRNTGTEKIEGLFVEISKSSRIQFCTNSFTRLNNLRLLKVYYNYWTSFQNNVKMQLPVDFEFPSFKLRYLHFENYSLESLPTKFDGRNIVELNLMKSSIKELWKDNEILNNLKVINLCNSEHLVKIPDFSSVPNLEILILKGCTSLKSLPSSIGHLKALKHLDLFSCANLVSLPESIWNLSSLETLSVLACPKLERLKVWLGEYGTNCDILKGGIWWEDNRFSSLKTLNLHHNKMEGEVLNHHLLPLSSLVKLNDSSHLSSLEVSSFGNFNPMARGILSDIFHQSSLETLSLHYCNLMEEGIRSDIWNLSSLVKLSLTNCNLMEGEILNHVCNLSSLQRLSLEGNHFSSIPAGISRLSHLKGLNLSHCNKLQEIPELPSSLRFLDVHCSEGILSSPSLLSIPSQLNCFNSKLIEEKFIGAFNSSFDGNGMSIVIPRSSGIVKGIRNQSMGSHRVTIELPQNWYENNDLLGFAVCCFFVHKIDRNVSVRDDELDETNGNVLIRNDELDEMDSDDEFNFVNYAPDFLNFVINSVGDDWEYLECDYPPLDIYCALGIRGTYPSKYVDTLSFESGSCCNEHNDDSVSDQVWVTYYPKDAIEEKYLSNQWTHLMASFHGWKTLEVKECGIHPIYGCFKCQQNEECQRKLCLKGKAINELPFIERPFELGSLCLRECKNLESLLPRTIYELKSLTTLSCSGCSQLKIFPEIPETTLENLRELHLDGTAIQALPSSIQHLRRLQRLNLAYCNSLVSLPRTICHLKSLELLSCSGCSRLSSFPEILEDMENLRKLYLDGIAIRELPLSIEHLGRLQQLHLSNCNNLVNLPESICNLKFLEILDLNFCLKLEKFPENLVSLQCLEHLGAAGFDLNMSSWEALNLSIVQLSKLRYLDLCHCQKLLQIPQLPQSLRFLDAHGCPYLETFSSPSSLLGFSLFKCFKSAIEEFEGGPYWSKEITIVIPGNNGIPKWISHQKKGSEIIIELPMEWRQDNNFLGFALCSVFVPLHIQSKEYTCRLKCELTFNYEPEEILDEPDEILGELSFIYQCCHNGGETNGVWVAYYPKVAIEKEDWSNEWRHLRASFRGERVKVEECGFQLIYEPNNLNRDTNGTKRSHDDADDHPVEDPHSKRSRHLQIFNCTQFSSSSFETQKSIEDLAMASTSTQMVSYSSTSNPRWSHEVFLSFRGTDTRYNFTEHLYKDLVQRGINTFRDGEIRRGGEIAVELLKTIEKSRSSIVVLSETYADSRWCLDELAKIMECRREFGLLVFPIFYHVDPSDVRKQSGRFGEAFAKYEENWKDEVQRWRAALTEAANLSGWHLLHGYDSKLVKEIIGRIVKRLNPKLLPVEEHIVGMDFRLKELKSLLKVHLDDIRIVGIYGRSGIGKTATAKMVYNQILCDFNGGCFLEDVKSRSKCINGRLQLLQELLHGILGVNVELNNINDGIDMIKGRLCSERVFVVIDDVDDSNQVKLLVKSCKWFGLGSRIILTTRDKRLLKVYGVDESYEAKGLCNEEAIHLFSCHAFKQNTPKEDYVDMSNPMVNYAQGLPLAIKVLGSFLHGKPIDEWKSTLDKLTEEDQEIYNVLKICYDGLDDNEKEILLDIACFFKGQDKDFALRILNSCNFFAEIGVRILCDRCFISISNNMISMHDRIQQMCWKIVCGKSHKAPHKWTRLGDPNDIRGAFLGEKGSKNIEVISCDLSRSKEIQCNTKVLTKMKKLRLLKLHWCEMLPPNFEFPSQELRCLHWDGYPLETLPSNFDGENLVELHLRNSTIKQLWKRSKGLEKLKVIDLSYSKQLTKVSKFSNMPNLERLNLEGCTSLCKLHSSVGALKRLTYLNLGGCEKLQSLPSSMKFESLEVLRLNGCRNFMNFPEVHGGMEHLKGLYLHKSGIKDLPSSIGSLTSLEILDLSECSNLEKFPKIHGNMKILRELRLNGTGIKELPSSIGSLTSLEVLDLSECSNFKKFPEIHGNMKFLRELHLNGTRIKELPSSIGSLTSLEILDLSECSMFEKFPDIFANMEHLRKLYLSNSGIKELSSNIGYLELLETLNLSYCAKLEKFPEIQGNLKHLKELSLDKTFIKELPNSIGSLEALQTLSLRGCSNFEKFPEIHWNMRSLLDLELEETAITELPLSIGHLTRLSNLNLENCKNLRSLPSSICRLKLLKRLSLNHCSNLKAFPEIMEDMEHLRGLELCEMAITELPSSIKHLRGLQWLKLINCYNLESLPNSIGNLTCLTTLVVCNCSKLHKLPNSLRSLQCCLTTLDLGGCNLMEGEIPSDIWCLSSLEFLDVSENHIRSIPSSIIQLLKLTTLCMNHCLMLEEIPELPSSLRRIEAHGCRCLETLSSPTHVLWSSLLNCFKSLIQAQLLHDILVQGDEEDSCKQQDVDLALPTSSGNSDEEEDPLGQIDVFIPGSSGIPEWVSHQNMGCEVTIELPMNWYEDNNFLGFALFFHLLPLDDDELVNGCTITQECKLMISHYDQSEMVDSISLDSFCEAYWISSKGVSSDPALRVTYFSKTAIPDHYHTSQWKNFKAQLDTPFVSCQCGKDRAFKVESCGIHFIYAQDHNQQNQNQWPQLLREKASSSHDDAEDHPQHKRPRHL